MATSDYTRAIRKNIKILDDRIFNAIMDFSRSDGVAVDFTGKTIKMEIYDRRGGTLEDTLTSEDEITISTARLSFSKILTDLSLGNHYFQVFNDTDKIGLRLGNLIVE